MGPALLHPPLALGSSVPRSPTLLYVLLRDLGTLSPSLGEDHGWQEVDVPRFGKFQEQAPGRSCCESDQVRILGNKRHLAILSVRLPSYKGM